MEDPPLLIAACYRPGLAAGGLSPNTCSCYNCRTMERRAGQHKEALPVDSRAEQSVYDRVLADEESRDAFFNTTQGILAGDPLQEDVGAIRQELDSASIAYLFTPDENLPRPTFYSERVSGVGYGQIRQAIAQLALSDSLPPTP